MPGVAMPTLTFLYASLLLHFFIPSEHHLRLLSGSTTYAEGQACTYTQ